MVMMMMMMIIIIIIIIITQEISYHPSLNLKFTEPDPGVE
jgi:hypothetical protein